MIRFALLFLLIFVLGCNKFKDEELSMQRIEYTGDELRIDGYYYRIYKNHAMNEESIQVCCLYQNGIFRWCGISKSFQDYENKIDDINKSKQYKHNWGVFIVENDIIKYEKWVGARALEPYITRIYAGNILNDTTFHITESYRPNGKERSTEDLMFHFRQFSPKPDSTNNFIK